MLPEIELSKKQARRFMLAHQGLWPPNALKGKDDILALIRHLGCIQFDPLNIVGRNADLVLQARVSKYRSELLQALLYDDRALLDGWDKNMSVYSLDDWPFFRRYRDAALKRFGDSTQPAVSILPQVREMIEERGPLSSIDLEFDSTVDWSWGPTRMARAALESMYAWGELIIHHRVNTRKIYDFASRHIPAEILLAPEPNETREAFHDWRVLRRIQGLGLIWNKSGDAWLGFRGFMSKDRTDAFARLIDRGLIVEVLVDGVDQPLYLNNENSGELERVLDTRTPAFRAAVLAPLDNLLWDRRFIQELFGFEYIWEVYKPVAERRYGYYVLPILYGDRFIARFEPTRAKDSGALIIKRWWWEPGVRQTQRMMTEIRRCFKRFVKYLGNVPFAVDDEVKKEAGIGWLDPSG